MQDQPIGSGDEMPAGHTQRRAMLAGVAGLAAGALLSSGRSAHAGPLNPPAGPIEPTMKRLDEVEPRIPINTLPGSSNSVHRILLPGSYYLTGDIVGEAGKSGIQVSAVIPAGHISIDLNGYRIRGVDGSFVGITCLGANPRLVVRNGQISGWGWNGVNANCPMVLEDLRIEGNGQGQATHGGARGGDAVAAQVRRCVFAANNGDGLRVGEGSTVENCSASDNSRPGITTASYCVVRHCDSQRNQTGIDFGSFCHIHSNNCSGSFCMGFVSTGNSSVVHDNTAIQNECKGFEIFGSGNIVVRNFAASNPSDYLISQTNVRGPVVGQSDIANNCNPHANLRGISGIRGQQE